MSSEAKKAKTSLRQRAEERLRARQAAKPPGPQSEADAQRLLQELQIHQVELELQNEELLQARGALEASLERYTDLYDFAPVSYFTLDKDHTIAQANLAGAGLLGIERPRLIGRHFGLFVAEADRFTFAACCEQAAQQMAKVACEVALQPANGEPRQVHLEMLVMGTEPTWRLAAIDITDRKLAEEALRASEARYRNLAEENGRLLAQSQADAETKAILLHEVNHRVKNNLAAIVGLLQLELRRLGSDQQTAYSSLVENLTGRIQSLALVHNLLSSASWAPLPLDKLAESVMQIAPVMISHAGGVLMDVAPTPVHLAPKQAGAVGLILNELATNSVKHAPRPGERIRLSLSTSQGDGEVCLEYRDNGLGYPEDVLQGKREGMGLYLIEALAEHDLAGKIALANDHGAVTRLRFALSFDVQSDDPPSMATLP